LIFREYAVNIQGTFSEHSGNDLMTIGANMRLQAFTKLNSASFTCKWPKKHYNRFIEEKKKKEETKQLCNMWAAVGRHLGQIDANMRFQAFTKSKKAFCLPANGPKNISIVFRRKEEEKKSKEEQKKTATIGPQ
jgi:lysyl-tRNA synthetase class II